MSPLIQFEYIQIEFFQRPEIFKLNAFKLNVFLGEGWLQYGRTPSIRFWRIIRGWHVGVG